MTMPLDPYKAPQAALDAPPASDPSAVVPASVVHLLGQTRPWVRLIAILFFVGLGAGGTLLLFTVSRLSPTGFSVASVIPLLLVAAFYVPPALFLWQYAQGIRRLQDGGGLPALEQALTSQKSFWKYAGVLVAVMLCIYAFSFLAVGMFTGLPRR